MGNTERVREGLRVGNESGKRAVLVLAAGNLAIPLASFATGPILARALGAEGRGNLAAVTAASTVAVLIAAAGLPAATTFFVAKRRVRNLVLRLAVIVLPMTLAAEVCLGLYSDLQSSELSTPFLLAMIFLPVGVVMELRRAWVLGQDRYSPSSVERSLMVLTRTAAFVLFTLREALTVLSALAITLSSSIVGALALVWPRGEVRRENSVEAPRLSIVASYGFRSWVTTLSAFANGRLDQLAMAVALSARELGYYAVAVGYMELTVFVTAAVATLVRTRAASLYEDEKVAEIISVVFWFTVVAAGSLMLVSPIVIPLLFGSEFAPAVPLVHILSLGYVALGSSRVIGSALAARDRPGLETVAELAGLVITATGLFLLLPVFGASGAAIVSTVAYFSTCSMLLYFFSRNSSVAIGKILSPRTGLELLRLSARRGRT